MRFNLVLLQPIMSCHVISFRIYISYNDIQLLKHIQGSHASSNLLNFYFPPQNSSNLLKKVYFSPKLFNSPQKKNSKGRFFLHY